mmetsp:Transcript_6544/g.27525  ORF Transcript_6544/g.27525 Transcript_6544/m.27525 type:complete len:111 (+) Transcript_6544:302-634(+)
MADRRTRVGLWCGPATTTVGDDGDDDDDDSAQRGRRETTGTTTSEETQWTGHVAFDSRQRRRGTLGGARRRLRGGGVPAPVHTHQPRWPGRPDERSVGRSTKGSASERVE